MTRRQRQDLDEWHQSERATFTDAETQLMDERVANMPHPREVAS